MTTASELIYGSMRLIGVLAEGETPSANGAQDVRSRTPGIYAIVNRLTGDMYVGSAVSINRRWNVHRCNLRAGKHHCKHLQNAYIKYGAPAFDWEVVEVVPDKADLLSREQAWIDFFRPAYNKRAIANSCLGVKRSPESRAKMRAAQLGKKHPPEVVAKRAAALRGRARSEETKARISASRMGLRPSEETRRKLSEAAKRRCAK